ncbi:hypothetical protein D3C81_2196030 [compost metagenome]
MAANHTACMDNGDFVDSRLCFHCLLQVLGILFRKCVCNNEELCVHISDMLQGVVQHLFDSLFLFAANLADRHDGAVN